MIETGKKLKDKREAANLTISEVSLATKINPKVLSALEEGQRDLLPATTFLRGFVRSYASYLKMDVDDVLATFNREISETEDPTDLPVEEIATSSVAVDVDGEGSGTLRMFIIGGILILVGLIIGVREVIEKYQAEKVTVSHPVLSTTPIQLPGEDNAIANATSVDIKLTPPKTEDKKESEDKTTKAPLVVKTADTKPEAKSDTKPEPKPEKKPEATAVTAKTATPPKASPAPAAIGTPTEAPKPEAEQKPADKKPVAKQRNQVILEALDSVNIKVHFKDTVKEASLAPGQVYAIKSNDPLVLDISDGGAVNIIYNGRDRGVPGDLGKAKKVSLP